MKYLKTKIEKFLESQSVDEEKLTINKYEIVVFNETITLKNIFAGDKNIDIIVNKGDKVKLFFNLSESNSREYCLTGVRPLEVLENESKTEEKRSYNLNELWVGNFILDKPMMVNSNSFTIEKYL